MTAFVACSKEGSVGPAVKGGKDGIDGSDGRNGTNETNGNANVKLYEFTGPYNFTTSTLYAFSVSSPKDTSNRSMFATYLVYEFDGEDNLFKFPGEGVYYYSKYNSGMEIKDTEVRVNIKRASGTGEIYSKVKIFRIYAHYVGKGIEPKYNGYTEAEIRTMDYSTFIEAMGINP